MSYQASLATRRKRYVICSILAVFQVCLSVCTLASSFRTLALGLTQELSSIQSFEQYAMIPGTHSLEFRFYTRYGYRLYGYRYRLDMDIFMRKILTTPKDITVYFPVFFKSNMPTMTLHCFMGLHFYFFLKFHACVFSKKWASIPLLVPILCTLNCKGYVWKRKMMPFTVVSIRRGDSFWYSAFIYPGLSDIFRCWDT